LAADWFLNYGLNKKEDDMKNLLHIIATPRQDESGTLKVTDAFLEVFKQKHSNWQIDELNLIKEELPALTMKRVGGKYISFSGVKSCTGNLKRPGRR
jgi:FMN-dependent NADH-azoreductase